MPAHRYVPGRLAVPLLAFAALGAFLGQPALAQDIQRPTTIPVPLSPAEEVTKLMNAGDLAAALKRADEFLVEKPRDLQVRFLRALILSDQKKTDEAAAAFETLTRDFPELPEPYNNLAVLYAAQGRLEEARALLRQALVAQPNYITAQENLGDLYVSLAAEAYQRVLKLNPNNRPAQAKLALTREIGVKLRAVR